MANGGKLQIIKVNNMVFFEVLNAAIALDFGFFIEFFLANLFWFFTLYALIYFFVEGKKAFKCFVILVLNLWVLSDWTALSGGVFIVGGLLLVNYITKLSTLKIAEHNKYLKPRMILVNEFFAWGVFILFNIAVVLGLWVL